MQTILGPLIDLLTWILDWLYSLGLTWGLAIIGLTIIVRLILFPLTWKQFKSAQEMQIVQPQIKDLQRKYKNDRAMLQQETMRLYQEHHVNPFASCLPLVLQLPIFISLYYTIRASDEIMSATFLGIPLGDPSMVLLVVYIFTQIVSTELMLVTQTDKTQKMIMRAMPVVFVIFLLNMPAGLYVYWITTNLWTIGQQLIIRRTMPKPEELAARAAAKPKKRSRFMDLMMASQEQQAQKRAEAQTGKKELAGGVAKQGAGKAGAKKAAPATRKSPPGKGQRKASQPAARGQGTAGTAPQRKRKPSAPAGKSGAKPSPPPGTSTGKGGTTSG